MKLLNSMVKYKVNLKFKDTGKSLNEIITQVLKIEKQLTCNNFKIELPFKCTHYSQKEGSSN